MFAEVTLGSDRLVLVKPLTFVNRSGDVIPRLLKKFQATPADLLVVFDQMDLAPGRMRLKPHGSAAGHNGLKSIDQALGNGFYHRLAIGVGRPSSSAEVVDHVLGAPSSEDLAVIQETLDRVVPAVNGVWFRGWESMINAVNQRHSDPS